MAFLNPRRFEYMFPVAAYALAEPTWSANSPPSCVRRRRRSTSRCRRASRAADGQRFASRAGRRADARRAPRRHPRHPRAAASRPTRNSRRWPALLAELVRRERRAASPRAPTPRGRTSRARCRIASPAARPPPRWACRRAPCWSPRSRPMCCSAASIRPIRPRRSSRGRSPAPIWWSPSPRICRRACAASAHVVLPIGSFAETSGTFVNAEGAGKAGRAPRNWSGESRPGWKVLRVLANLLNVPGVDYVSSEEIREALERSPVRATRRSPAASLRARTRPSASPDGADAGRAPGWTFRRIRCDALVRGSEALGENQGRAHDPRRDLTCGIGAPFAIGCPATSRRTGPIRC